MKSTATIANYLVVNHPTPLFHRPGPIARQSYTPLSDHTVIPIFYH